MITLEEAKLFKLSTLNDEFKQVLLRPIIRIDTGTRVVNVDSGRADLDNLKIAQKHGANYLMDADNILHVGITTEEWDIIIFKIEEYGIYLYNRKWALKDEIEACTTVDAVHAVQITF